MIKPEGRGFNSHPGQSFPLSLCGPNSISRANAHMVYGLKHQHFTLQSITLFVLRSFFVFLFSQLDAYDTLESEPEMRVGRSLTDSDLLIALAQVSENKDMIIPESNHLGKHGLNSHGLNASLNSSLGSLGGSLNSSNLLMSKGKESTGSVPRKSARGKRKLDSSQQLSSSKKSKG